MTQYALVYFDTSKIRLTELPWRFETREEALCKLAELTLIHPDQSYAVKIVPAA